MPGGSGARRVSEILGTWNRRREGGRGAERRRGRGGVGGGREGWGHLASGHENKEALCVCARACQSERASRREGGREGGMEEGRHGEGGRETWGGREGDIGIGERASERASE